MASASHLHLQLHIFKRAMMRSILDEYACQCRKTLAFRGETDKASHVSVKLGATVSPGSIVALHTAWQWDIHSSWKTTPNNGAIKIVSKSSTLVALPVGHTKQCVVPNWVRHREAHLPRNTHWMILAQPLRRVEDALLQGMCRCISPHRLVQGAGSVPAKAWPWGHGSTAYQR